MIIKCFLLKSQCFKIRTNITTKCVMTKNKKYLLLFVPVALFPKTGQTFNSIMMETSRRNQKSKTTLLVQYFQRKYSTKYSSLHQREYIGHLHLSAGSNIPVCKVHVTGSSLCKLNLL